MSAFKHRAVSFGTLDMTPPDVESYISPISLHNALTVVCWSGICRLGSIEIGSLCPINTLPFDHKSGSPESQSDLLPDINKPPLQRVRVDRLAFSRRS